MADADDTRPNILFFLTDQERYDCSVPGGPEDETQPFERLSNEGIRFEQAFTPISICSSARASLLTGQFPHGHGMINNCHEDDAIQPNLPPDIPTFSEELDAAGYDLTYTGKWHTGRDRTPEDFGFSYLGGSDKHHDDIDEAFIEYRKQRGTPVDEVELTEELYTGDDPRDGSEGTLVAATAPIDVEDTRAYFLAKLTIEEIERHVDGGLDAPFFHRTDFYGPHHPYVIPEHFESNYGPDEVELLINYAETFDGKPRVQENYLSYRGVDGFDWELWKEAIAKYRRFVMLIDQQVGRILEALEDNGLDENTVVVHTSDHGDFAGGHRQFNKGPLMYDDTYHIPLQIRGPKNEDIGPKIDAGSSCEKPVHLHDLAATFLEIADVPVPDEFDSKSLVSLFEKSSDSSDRAESDEEESSADSNSDGGDKSNNSKLGPSVFGQYHGDEFGLYSQRMVRTERFKYVYNGPDIDELYDLKADPAELRNLIDRPEYADKREEMRKELIDWMDKTDDPIRKWVTDVLEDAS
ncbi:sulfatase-like hydrolase/transferase [Natrinema caseinilyticum]|uniref:sulfatase-like hydrolase/transferase n=1 Tax=Natrinema caseinilyticum TaxID=2961570 RepID=UPI0020C28D1C|nr:sulfatase-like hydrolase/transferase [Natrinema caseinilyticum]